MALLVDGVTKENIMDDQHQKITGYRELTQEEIDLINKVKEAAGLVMQIVDRLSASDAINAEGNGIDLRWVSIGRTSLQQGFMALTRAIAQPTTF